MNLSPEQKTLINKTVEFVKTTLKAAEGGHDWWHIYRVWKLAIQITEEEKADQFIEQLGALFHDIADSKFHDGNEEIGPRIAKEFLKSEGVSQEIIAKIESVIRIISFKNSIGNNQKFTKEEMVIQDADRLDAIGAIGIARTFNYGGHKNFVIYNPDVEPRKYQTKEEYKKSEAPTVNHFYEKLFLLKDMMNTLTGMRLAEGRHQFMELYLQQFYDEWEGVR